MAKFRSVTIATVCLSLVVFGACNNHKGAGNQKNTDTASAPHMKWSARQRLIKNNILERHVSWASCKLQGKVRTYNERLSQKEGTEMLVNWEENDVFNNVGQLIERTYKSHMDNGTKDKILWDADGNDTAWYTYNDEGKLIRRAVMRNDQHGNLMSADVYDVIGTKQPTTGTVNKYDSMDNLVGLDFFYDGKLYDKWTFTYDGNGIKSGGATFDSLGHEDNRFTCVNDSNGNRTAYTDLMPDGGVAKRMLYKYDGTGHCVEELNYWGADSLLSRDELKYDTHNHAVESISYRADGSVDSAQCIFFDYTYDQAGNITTKNTYKFTGGQKEKVSAMEGIYTYF